MAKFRFVVRSSQGKTRRGTVTEASMKAARERLENAGFKVIQLFEEAEMVIHETAAPGRPTAPKPERAEIIEFESSFGEKLMEFLNQWILRKEMAAVLLFAGLIAMGVSWVMAPEKEELPTLKYTLYSITVDVDRNGLEGSKLEVFLPDIPYKAVEDATTDAGPQTVTFEIEAAERPAKVEVTLQEFDGEPVGRSSGSLTPRAGKENGLGAKQTLEKVKQSP